MIHTQESISAELKRIQADVPQLFRDLLFVKTKIGYEMKCPRTKKICLVKYEEMLRDCFDCMEKNAGGEDFLNFLKTNKQ